MPEIIIKLGDKVVQKYYLYKDSISIGRAPENEISIENLAVSRRHAEIREKNGSYLLEDLDSANGTFVNGVQVTRTEIFDKDVIGIGKHKLHFYDQQAASMDGAEKTMLLTRPAATKAALRVIRGKQKDQIFQLNKVESRVGRAADNDIRLSDWFVSKYHAEITRRGMVYVIRDLGSWRHTLVNGHMIDEQALKPGDEIQFGPKIAVVFEVKDGTSAREGTGRRPVELDEVDQAPLPLQGDRPNTPLPIVGSAFSSAVDSDIAPAAEENGSGNRPFDDLMHAAVLSDDDSDIRVEDAEPEEPVKSTPEAEAASVALQGIRLDEYEPGTGAGWDEAGELAAGALDSESGDDIRELDAEKGSWDEPGDGDDDRNEADLDSVSVESAQEVEWVEEIEADEGDIKAAGHEDDEGQVPVATLDSAGLESPAVFGDTNGELPLDDAKGLDRSPAAEVGLESFEKDAQLAEAEVSLPEAASLADAILAEHGEDKGLDRTEVAMWVQALHNPSKVIRRQAQRKLQKLTGQVYDIEL
jgi:pSer/pThr/pTyr-binding forkhead associated (FHA) protein